MKASKKFTSLFCLLLLVSSCSPSNVGEWISVSSSSVHVNTTTPGMNVSPFNTVFLLKYFKNDKKNYNDNFDEELKNTFIDEIVSLHKEFDRHYNYKISDASEELITNVKVINDSYGSNEWISCSDELYDLVRQGYELTLLTKGYFNFFMGRLTDFWDRILAAINDYEDPAQYDPLYNENQKIHQEELAFAMPSQEEVKGLISFDDTNKKIRFNTLENVQYKGKILERDQKDSLYRPLITSGGIAKGLGADYIKQALVEKGYTDGYINCGSSSISMLSNPSFSDTGKQKINIKDPRSEAFKDKIAFSFNFDYEFNLSTSGNYTIGHSYTILHPETKEIIYRHHIIDPYTGDCSQHHSSVSIFSKTFSNGQLDALSTTLVNLSTEDGLEFRKELLNDFPNHDLGIVFMDLDLKNDNLKLTITKEHKNLITIQNDKFEVVYA